MVSLNICANLLQTGFFFFLNTIFICFKISMNKKKSTYNKNHKTKTHKRVKRSTNRLRLFFLYDPPKFVSLEEVAGGYCAV